MRRAGPPRGAVRNAATSWPDRAMAWAHEALDHVLVSYLLTRKSHQARDQRDPERVIGLARAAQQVRAPLPPRVRALAAQEEAHGHALAGDEVNCHRKLDEALEVVARSHRDGVPAPGRGRYCTEVYIAPQRANGPSTCTTRGSPSSRPSSNGTATSTRPAMPSPVLPPEIPSKPPRSAVRRLRPPERPARHASTPNSPDPSTSHNRPFPPSPHHKLNGSSSRRSSQLDRKGSYAEAVDLDHDDGACLERPAEASIAVKITMARCSARRPGPRRSSTLGSEEPVSASMAPKSVSAVTSVRSWAAAVSSTFSSSAPSIPRSPTWTAS